jgi:hypothetical protein
MADSTLGGSQLTQLKREIDFGGSNLAKSMRDIQFEGLPARQIDARDPI